MSTWRTAWPNTWSSQADPISTRALVRPRFASGGKESNWLLDCCRLTRFINDSLFSTWRPLGKKVEILFLFRKKIEANQCHLGVTIFFVDILARVYIETMSWPYSWSRSFFLLCLVKRGIFHPFPLIVPSHFEFAVMMILFFTCLIFGIINVTEYLRW